MKYYISTLTLCLLGLPILGAEPANQAALAHWPQWRGPLASGVAPQADPPLTWSETKNVRWKVKIPGSGTATPILWGNKLFILTAIPTGRKLEPAEAAARKAALATLPGGGRRAVSTNVEPPQEFFRFTVLCLDRQTGKTLWEKVAGEEAPHEGHHKNHGYASASPITDGTHLIVSFGSHGLYCYDLAGGLVWKKDLGKLHTRKSFGEASSPALHGDTVVMVRDHEEEDVLLAFDKRDGRELWRVRRDEPTAWSTPLIVEHGGRTQVLVASSSGLRAYDLKDGHELWVGPALTDSVIPSPVLAHGMVFATSDHHNKKVTHAVRLGRTGALAGTDAIVWNYSRYAPYVSSPLVVENLIYLASNTNGLMTCLNALTGEPHFEAERIPGLRELYASPVAAKDRVYILSREGSCVVLKQGPKLEVLATNALDEKTDASMVLAGKDVFIRGQVYLYRIAED
jgi:outer membrane protein assembly factor BamB